MPFNLPQVPGGRLTAADMGVPDYAGSLSRGFALGMQPSKQAESLLSTMLANKIQGVKAKFAPQMEQANLENILGQNQTRNITNKELAQRLHAVLMHQQYANEDTRRMADIKQKYPLFGQPGAAGQIAALQWLQDHPGETQSNQDLGSRIPSVSGAEQLPVNAPVNYMDLLKQSIIASATPKTANYQGPAREAADLERLRQAYGENSPVYQDARKLAAIKQEGQETLSKQRERRASGLKPGEDWVSNKEGQHIGISRPLSEREKKEVSGRSFFNVVYPDILKSTSYYSGTGSITRFNNDIANYNNNKNAQKRIDNYLAAVQLLPSTMVKENATVGGANTNQVYNRLIKSLTASDLPIELERLETQFRLPRGAKLRAGLKFQSVLNKATQAGEKTPARRIEYLSGKKEGHIFNKDTNKLEKVLVSPEEWDAFREAGGY